MRTTENLPGYLSHKEAKKLTCLPIGLERLLTIYEEADMLAIGLDRKKIADITPKELRVLADFSVDRSNIFLGS